MGKKPANQGGVAKANVAPSRTSGTPTGGGKTPGLGSGNAANPIIHVKGIGGTAKPAR